MLPNERRGGGNGNGASGVTSRHAPSGTRYAARLVPHIGNRFGLASGEEEEEGEEEGEGQERTAVVAAAVL